MLAHAPRMTASLLAAAVLAASSPASTHADDITNQIARDQGQQTQLASSVQDLQAQIANNKNKEAALQQIISNFDTQIAQTQNQIDAAQGKLNDLAGQLASAQQQLQAVIQQMHSDEAKLQHEMVVVYHYSANATVLTALLQSDSFNEFWQQLFDAQRIADAEQSLVDQVKQDEKTAQQLVDQIAQKKAQQAQVLNQLQTNQANLQAQRGSQANAKELLRQTIAADQAQVAAWQAAQAQLNAEIADLQAKEAQIQAALAGRGGTGQFQWPEQGVLTQGFGCVDFWFEPYDASCPYPHRFHSGIDIGSPYGTPLQAADAGMVYTYPWNGCYGNLVLIDHGNGFITAYGHTAGFAVASGTIVYRGQTVAYEGSTGCSTGAHLHFEIRLHGNFVDPLSYLP
jgi:murein DD-endopeptidase MepM/ murein hydrolase activator NlpD